MKNDLTRSFQLHTSSMTHLLFVMQNSMTNHSLSLLPSIIPSLHPAIAVRSKRQRGRGGRLCKRWVMAVKKFVCVRLFDGWLTSCVVLLLLFFLYAVFSFPTLPTEETLIGLSKPLPKQLWEAKKVRRHFSYCLRMNRWCFMSQIQLELSRYYTFPSDKIPIFQP